MRIITGQYKGRVITTVNDRSVRPATDRVRQTVFNMLANRLDLEGARVLDLFAGSGSLGFEALSRGASHVTFVENNHDAAVFIEHNALHLGCEAASEIIEMDSMVYLLRPADPFQLIFADPPYRYPRTPDIPDLVFRAGALSTDGYLVIEHATDLRFEPTSEFAAGPEKKFGRTLVTFFRHRQQTTPTDPHA